MHSVRECDEYSYISRLMLGFDVFAHRRTLVSFYSLGVRVKLLVGSPYDCGNIQDVRAKGARVSFHGTRQALKSMCDYKKHTRLYK